MITVQEADNIIKKNLPQWPSQTLPLNEAYGAVLHEDIKADRHWPPFDKSLMDGIAISSTSWKKGIKNYHIIGTQAAGIPALQLNAEDHCSEIMTGAVLTKGADCVIPIEQITIDNKQVILNDEVSCKTGQNIRYLGIDYKKNDVLLKKGTILYSPQIAVCANVGKSSVEVAQKPKIAIFSTGDEIVTVDSPVKEFQTRSSNAFFVKTAIENSHLGICELFHIRDDKDVIEKELKEKLASFDMLVLSGGVSMGKLDFIPEVLENLSVDVLFHKITQRPGKPFWFGKNPKGKLVFALPGNPLSTQVGTFRYVIPALMEAAGAELRNEEAIMQEDFTFEHPLTYFLLVRLKYEEGMLKAYPINAGGSGDFAVANKTDGFLELPSKTDFFPKGTIAKLYRWH